MQIDPFEMLWNAFLPILSTFTGGLVTDLTTLMIAILIIICILIGFDLLFDALTGSERTLSGFREQQRQRRMRALDPAPTRNVEESEIFLSGSQQHDLDRAYENSNSDNDYKHLRLE